MARDERLKTHQESLVLIPKAGHGDADGCTVLEIRALDTDPLTVYTYTGVSKPPFYVDENGNVSCYTLTQTGAGSEGSAITGTSMVIADDTFDDETVALIRGNAITTGNALKIFLDTDLVTTGKAINVISGATYGAAVSKFSVDEDGNVIVAGTLSLAGAASAIVVPASSSAVGTAIGITAGAGNGGTTTGFAGGAFSTTTGAGTAGTTTAGAGGAMALLCGNGGTTTTGTTGAGGAVTITAGNSGAASSTGTAGLAGTVTITAGTAGTTAIGTSAVGGSVSLLAGVGSGGTPTVGGVGGQAILGAGQGGAGTTGGVGGLVNIYSGAPGAGGSPANGIITLRVGGASGTTSISIGATGIVELPVSLTVGGGYGSAGATISTAGVGQFNGALTTDSTITSGLNGTSTGGLTVNGSTNGSIVITPIASGTGATTIQNSAGTPTITLPATTCTLAGLGLANAWTAANTFTATGITDAALTMVYGNVNQTTTALTGDIIGVRGNARIDVDSASGKAIGGYFLAGNTTYGFNAEEVRGVYCGTMCKTPTSANKTHTNVKGIEIVTGNTALGTTYYTDVTNLYGVRLRIGSSTGQVGTSKVCGDITNGYGVWVDHQQQGDACRTLDAGFYLSATDISGGNAAWAYGLDMSAVGTNMGTADIRLSQGETIDNLTNGTINLTGTIIKATGTLNVTGITTFGNTAHAGLLFGSGVSGTTFDVGASGGKAMSFYLSSASVNTAHSLEGLYVNVDFGNGTGATAAPHGEAGRFRASLKGSPTGVCGSHNTVEWISAGSSCSGATYGTYSNLVFLDSTAGGGRLSGLCAELFSGGASTDLTGASASCLCLSIQGTVTANKFTVPLIDIEIPTDLVGAGLIVDDTASAVTIDGKIRIRINGVDKWLLYDDDHD